MKIFSLLRKILFEIIQKLINKCFYIFWDILYIYCIIKSHFQKL